MIVVVDVVAKVVYSRQVVLCITKSSNVFSKNESAHIIVIASNLVSAAQSTYAEEVT